MAGAAIDEQTILRFLSMDLTIGYKLRRAQLTVFQDFIDTFSEMKLRPAEFAVISIIAANPGLKQATVAETLGIKPANLVALIDNIEKRGLAERRRGDADRRTYSLYLTNEGRRFVREMYETWHFHEKRMIERLGGEAERDALIDLLDRLIEPKADSLG